MSLLIFHWPKQITSACLTSRGSAFLPMCLKGREQEVSMNGSKNTNHMLRARELCEVVDSTRTLQTDHLDLKRLSLSNWVTFGKRLHL